MRILKQLEKYICNISVFTSIHEFLIANYENKIIQKKTSPAPAAEIILTLSPKATLDEFFTCPACERDTIKMGVLLSFICLTKIS